MDAAPQRDFSREYAQFREEGYAVLRGVLDVALDIQPLIDEYAGVVDDLIETLHAAGKLSHAYRGLDPVARISAFVADTGKEYFDHLSIFIPFAPIDPDRPMYLHPAMFAFFRNPRLLDAIEPILGPEIAVSPFHFMRIKPPERLLPEEIRNSPNGIISQTVWHQDLWGLEEAAKETRLVTVWAPLLPADEGNGCLVVAPGTHRARSLEVHCKPSQRRPNSKGIPDELVPRHRVPVPVEPGDVILLDKLLQHSSLVNRSDRLRWSCDLRYQAAGEPVGQCGRQAWVARSHDPAREMTAFDDWRRMWRGTIADQARDDTPDPTRFSIGHPLCV